MPRFSAILLLAACANEEKLAELEARQNDLRSQYDGTAREMTDMRAQLIAMGVIAEGQASPKGKNTKGGGAGSKARLKVGNPTPNNNVTGDFAVAATRTGEIPTLPALAGAPERGDSACGWKFVVKELADISDYNLNSIGLGRSGPVLLYADGKPMAAHASPAQYDETCANAFRHAGWAFLFSPENAPENAENHTYTIALEEQVPLLRGEDGRPIYWVYPGTTLTFTAGKAWDPKWGALDVDLVVRRIDDGEPPEVTIGGKSVEVPDDRDAAHVHLGLDPVPTEPLTVTVTAPPTGAYVVVDTLTVGNPDTAAVVTSEVAYRAARKAL